MNIRVVVCNRSHLYTEGLRRLLEEDRVVSVVGLVSDDRDLERMEELAPDVIITDSAFFPKVAGRSNKVLLIWSGNGRHSIPHFGDLKTMVDQGLAGILDAGTDSALMRKAVAKVHAGELWVDRQFVYNSLRTDGLHREIRLSRRETEILHNICEGYSNKEIAVNLCISEQTVKTHCNHLYKKFGVSSRLQLALAASSAR